MDPLFRKRRRRSWWIAGSLFALLVLLAAAWRVWRSPPALARLLPEADALVYADLRPLRLLTHLDQHPVDHSPDYQRFIDATGIVPERDLRELAVALHRMPDANGPNGITGYSEVLSGRFDRDRLTGYLRSLATCSESYAGHEIFNIPVGDPSPHGTRTLRITVLDGDAVAASNMPTPEQIHAVLDHERTPGLMRGGPVLLTRWYAELPVGASAWGIGQLALPFTESGHVTALGLRLPIPAEQPMLASLRYTTGLHLRLDLVAGGEQAATTQTEALRAMLDLVRALGLNNAAAPAPPAISELLQSFKITPERDRTVVRAEISASLVRTLAAGEQNGFPQH